ncbi:hypothetical protein INR49_023769 [Caranx melampygus]|nr:hypothetical protein INR49_023769 [Caranx melampygus]
MLGVPWAWRRRPDHTSVLHSFIHLLSSSDSHHLTESSGLQRPICNSLSCNKPNSLAKRHVRTPMRGQGGVASVKNQDRDRR